MAQPHRADIFHNVKVRPDHGGQAVLLYLIQKVLHKVEGTAHQRGVLSVTAQPQIAAVGVELVILLQKPAQIRHVRLQKRGHEAADHDITIQHHADVVDADGQMHQDSVGQ